MAEMQQPQVDIEKELRKSYLEYSLSVIIGRAIPDARDGLKPVHRRILFAQYELANNYNRPHKKSARIVGDVIGKYHPHVRYSTTGRSSSSNAQPFLAHFKGRDVVLAHNGNLVNAAQLREDLENEGAIFSTSNDTEVFMHLLVRALRHNDLPGAVKETCARVRGAYCLLVMVGGVMVAVRDPHGFHPLAFGRINGSPVFASETCAFDLLEAQYERSVEPGEIMIVDGNSVRSERLMGQLPERPRQCIFELVYFARPDSYIFDEQVYLCRKKMGWNLADESAPEVDFVMTRKEIDAFTEFVKIYGAQGLAWIKIKADEWQSPIAKFLSDAERKGIADALDLKVGDIVFFQAGEPAMNCFCCCRTACNRPFARSVLFTTPTIAGVVVNAP